MQVVTAVLKSVRWWISPFCPSNWEQIKGWVLPVLWVGFAGSSFCYSWVLSLQNTQRGLRFFCVLRLTCTYACHTDFDSFASYLIQYGQDFILCQCSQRLQWKNFTVFVHVLTSKGTTENLSKEIATVVFSVVFVLLMKSVIGLCVICLVKNEISFQEWIFKT